MADSDTRKTVAVIGLGNMGAALAHALLVAGWPVVVWNRTGSKSKPLLEQGATVAGSAAKAARAADVILVCVSNQAAFASIIESHAVADALSGKLLAQLGVVTAEESRETAAWATARGIDYLEASIVGVPRDVEKSAASLVCSGPASLFDACEDILSVFGSCHHVSESRGAAFDFDKVMYCYGYASMLGFVQGAALAQACGFSIGAFADIVAERSPAITDKVRVLGKKIADRNYEVHAGSVEVWAEAFEKTLRLCRSRGVGDALPAAIMDNFNKAMSAGYGDKEITAVFEVLLPSSG